jgi:hypothetical protein
MTRRSTETGSTRTVLRSGLRTRSLGRDIERRVETDGVRRLLNTTGRKLAREGRVRGRAVGRWGSEGGVLGRKKSTSSLGGRSQVSRTCQIDMNARQSKFVGSPGPIRTHPGRAGPSGANRCRRRCPPTNCSQKASMSGRSALIIVSTFKLQVMMGVSTELCYG